MAQPGPAPEASDHLAPEANDFASFAGALTRFPPIEMAYLDEALDIIQKHALHKDKVDWPSLRTKLLEQGKNFNTRTETYSST
jgi:hypothetical protein